MCMGAENLYDNTIMLSYLVPLLLMLLITLLIDLYTFYYINYYKHSSEEFSAHHAEYYYLKDICKNCHTHCNDKSIAVQKLDVPLKSTVISCIPLACTFFSLISMNDNPYLFTIILFVWIFFTTVNIPMIVYLSTKNNFANISVAKQWNNTLGWNRTKNQQWERKCALEDRIQNVL